MAPEQPHRIAALAYPGMAPFELSVVVEVFGLSRPDLDVACWYALEICAEDPGVLPAVGGIGIEVHHGLTSLANADTVIVPGWPIDQEVSHSLVDALHAVHQRGGRLVSICSGAFVLAAAGLLDGRRAATHWRYAAQLAARYPLISVDRDVLYVDEDSVLTSAGSAAGIDLCLHLVRKDHGAAVANHVAKRLVTPPHRDGGQAQFIDQPVATDADARIHDIVARVTANVAQTLSVPDLALLAHMSPRQFSRRFRQVVGESPMAWLIGRRVAASLALLEIGDDSVERVSATVGFASPTTFRHHFWSRMRTTPTAYRRAFRG